MFLLAASFLLPWIAGFLLAFYLLAGTAPRTSHLAPAAALGMGLGFGMASCVAYLGLLIFGSFSSDYVITDLAFFTAVILALAWRVRPLLRNIAPDPLPDRSWLNWLIGLVFFTVFVFMVLSYVGQSKPYPFGGGDGLQIFSIHARFMLRGGEHWKDMFLVEWSHPDYPLLIPALLARGWTYAGGETPLVPVILYLLFSFAATAVLMAALAHHRGRLQGTLAGILLMSTASFVFLSAFQYADIAVSYYYLAAVTVLVRENDRPFRRYLLAGMLAALAAWTKNEGLMFLLVILVSHTLAGGIRKSTLYFLLGMLPVLAVVLHFKIFLAPPTDLVVKQDPGTILERLVDLPRYAAVAKQFLLKTYSWCDYKVPLLLAVLLLTGISIKKDHRFCAKFLGLILVFMMAGYFLVYLLTPQPLHWHISFSYRRLFLQLWPVMIFLVFMIANFRKVQSA